MILLFITQNFTNSLSLSFTFFLATFRLNFAVSLSILFQVTS